VNRFLLVAIALALLGVALPKARAVCRVLGPTTESGEHEVVFDSTTQALYVMAPNQLVGFRCRSVVYQPGLGSGLDLGPVAGYDYAVPVEDAHDSTRPSYEPPFELEVGAPEGVGEALDARELAFAAGGHRSLIDGGVFEPGPALCPDGAPPDPIYGGLVHTVIQPALYAMGGRSGLVMPLPARADVHVGVDDIFVAAAASVQGHVTETVDFVEDGSIGYQCSDPHYASNALDAVLGLPMAMMGCGAYEGSAYYDPGLERRGTETEETRSGSVAVDRITTTENYEVVVLNASNLNALTEWLDINEFSYDDEDVAAFSSYVKEGAWFLAVRVQAPELPGNDRVALAPLVVTWRGDDIPVMNRLQYSASGGVVETDAFVIAPTRMAVEDGDGEVEIASPASFEDPAVRAFGLEQGWVTRIRLTRRVDEVKEDSRLVPTDDTEVDPLQIERRRTVYIAQACCPGNSYPAGGQRTFSETYEYLEGEPSPAPDFYRAPGYTRDECAEIASAYSSAPPPTYYACSVDASPAPGRASRPSRISMALSWLPFLAIFFGLRRRSRR